MVGCIETTLLRFRNAAFDSFPQKNRERPYSTSQLAEKLNETGLSLLLTGGSRLLGLVQPLTMQPHLCNQSLFRQTSAMPSYLAAGFFAITLLLCLALIFEHLVAQDFPAL